MSSTAPGTSSRRPWPTTVPRADANSSPLQRGSPPTSTPSSVRTGASTASAGTLFNGFLAGAGLDGNSWLYVNPLQVREGYEGHRDDQSARRTPWFRCACCPPNVMRLPASLPHYVASTGADREGVQLHQYATGAYGPVSVRTGYPWDGRIAVTAVRPGTWTLSLRIPAWCSGATLDGAPVAAEAAGCGCAATGSGARPSCSICRWNRG